MKLLKFWSEWCNPCKQQTKEFEENPVAVEVKSIDVDEDTEGLTDQYKIMSVPTILLVDNEGTVIKRWVGFTPSSTINQFIEDEQKTKK
jgi:thioredoxin 1